MGNKIPDTHAMDLIMALSLEVLKGNPISNKCYKASKVIAVAADRAMRKYKLRIDELVIVLLIELVSSVSAGKLKGDTDRAIEYWESLPEIIFDDKTKEETTCH